MNKILILDIETTGFLKQGGSIVEIGISSLCLDTGNVEIIYDQICKEDILTPEHELKPYGWIFENSDLTMYDVLKGKPFELVKYEIQHILNKYPLGVTAFNKKFDFDFLRDRGIEIKKELPCIMHSCTNVCKIKKNGKNKWPNVEEAFKHFYPELIYKEKHRAGDDSKHEAMIVKRLIELGKFKI